MATGHAKHHDYHLADPSSYGRRPISAFVMALGAVAWMHKMFAVLIVLGVGTIGVFYTMASCAMIREAWYKGVTPVSQLHRYGMILLIAL